MPSQILVSKDVIVIPGIDPGMDHLEVTQKHYETPFGLFIPIGSYGHVLLRFLKYFNKIDKDTSGYIPNLDKYIGGYLLTPNNIIELVDYRKDDDDVSGHLYVREMPVPDRPFYVILAKIDLNIPINEHLSTLSSIDECLTFLNNTTTERILRPIIIDRKAYCESVPKEYRKNVVRPRNLSQLKDNTLRM